MNTGNFWVFKISSEVVLLFELTNKADCYFSHQCSGASFSRPQKKSIKSTLQEATEKSTSIAKFMWCLEFLWSTRCSQASWLQLCLKIYKWIQAERQNKIAVLKTETTVICTEPNKDKWKNTLLQKVKQEKQDLCWQNYLRCNEN